ncbi:MAG TPA: M6 family metalloprotease domain-containing protein [Longimicrobiales bacterium]|nr:M6 family metalloprotease domain-containing protein [Longimicrobiales bacterium]
MRSRPRTGAAARLAAVALTLLGGPGASAAQHVAAPVEGRGTVLPAAYQRRVSADPRAFTLPNGLFTVGPEGRPQTVVTLGTKRMLVLPALFSDSPAPHVSSADMQRLIFDGPAPRGTLTGAYQEMSRGRFRVTGDVLPWVRTSLPRAVVVGDSAGLGSDARVGAYLLETLAAVDPVVDFGAYDNDGPDGMPNSGDDDGLVDAIAFQFIEVAASCGGPGIWPHLWAISPQNDDQPFSSQDRTPSGGRVRVDGYIVQSAVDCGGVSPMDAGTIAHEFGHVLGLPDYYHPTAVGGAEVRRWVIGCWELMAAGSWGCGPVPASRAPFGPTHLSARSKHVLGWLDYVTVGEVWDQEVVLDPVQVSGKALRIPLDAPGREALLVEYRTRAGFDAELPAEGVLVYHLDESGEFRPAPGSGAPYLLSLLEQDDNRGLQRNALEGGNRGEAGDAWGVGGSVQKLHFGTRPALYLHATGAATSVTFHEITVNGGKAVLRLSTGASPRIMAPAESLSVSLVAPFERRLRIAGGVMPYMASGSVPSGTSVVAEGDELVLSGTLTQTGPFDLVLRVTDARGAAAPEVGATLATTGWVVADERLLQAFLRSRASALTSVEARYLDDVGNRNGRYDVGDLRAWLRGQVPGGG